MKNTAVIFPILILLAVGCGEKGTQQATEERSLQSYFKVVEPAETVRFEVADDGWAAVGDTIPNRFFFSQMETRLMNSVPYFDNSGELILKAESRFPLAENVDAYLVNMAQGWYRHQSLFLFDLQKKEFTDRLTVADFYGGDGGQILTGSYLLDYDGDGDKDLVHREIEHWLVLDEDTPRDTMTERAALLLWNGQKFAEAEFDSAELVKRFPIESFW